MSQVIVCTDSSGVSIIYPTEKALDTLSMDGIAVDSVPEGVAYRITDKTNVPTDRSFRNAWTDDAPGETVGVDMDKAKVIQADRIRKSRDAKWPEYDGRYVASQRKNLDLTSLDLEGEMLRNIPNKAQDNIDSAENITELKSAWPTELT